MRRSLPASIVLAAAILCSADGLVAQDGSDGPAHNAATAGGNPAQAIGGAVKGFFGFLKGVLDQVLNPQVAELKRLVADGKFDAAAEHWLAHQADVSKAEDAASLAAAIGKGLGEQLGAEAPALLRALEAMTAAPAGGQDPGTPGVGQAPAGSPGHWSATPQAWPQMRSQLASAESLVQRARTHPFFAGQPALLPPWVESLSSASAGARGRIAETVARAFVAYDHRGEQPFFDAYPTAIEPRARAALAVRGAPVWMSALLGGTEAQARTVARTFAPHVRSPEARGLIASAYAGVVARERQWGDSRELPQIVQLMQALDDAGLDVAPAARAVRIGVVRGLNAAADGFQWRVPDRIAAAIPVQDFPHEALEEWVREVASVRPQQIYVLVDPARVAGGWRVAAVAERTSQRTVGRREEANPAWSRAREELEEARQELESAEQSNRQAQAQAQQLAQQSRGSSMGAWGAVLGSSMSSINLSSARDRVTRAERAFAETPRTVTTAVAQPYRVAVAGIELTQTRQVALYVVDGARGQYRKLEWRDAVRRVERLEFGLDPRDSGYAAVEARNGAARERLRRFAATVAMPDAADIWRRLLAAAAAGEAAPITALPQALRDDHARWAADADAERARAQAAAEQLEERVLAIVQNQR